MDRKDLSWALTAGLAVSIAVASAVRPSTYYFPLILSPLLFLAALKRVSFIKAIGYCFVFLIFSYIPLFAWQLRNYHEVGSWRFSGIESINMYYYRAGAVLAHR